MTSRVFLSVLVCFFAAACSDDTTDNPMDASSDTATPDGNVDGGLVDGQVDGAVEDPEPTCANYCATIMANCTGANAQYVDMTECMTYCDTAGAWEAGTRGETSGNTIACRIYHGNAPSVLDPATHCNHAGPTGGNMCGTWCDNYCNVIGNTCRGSDAQYANEAECRTACGMIFDGGFPGITGGDSIQCRIYHGGIPASMAPATHCPHAGADGAGVCVFDDQGYDFRMDAPATYTRVDRVGMPAVSTVLATDKNAYNDGNPSDDAMLTFAGEILGNLGGLHMALDDDLQDASLTPCSMAPSDPMDPMSLPGCVAQEVAAGVPVVSLVVPDTLTLDTTAPSGFPNGRMLADPVIDVTLAVILLDLTRHQPDTLVGTNPTANDLPFQMTFPYLADPHAM